MAHHHHHDDDEHLGGGHGIGWLDPLAVARRDVHRIGRRKFVADLGRRTFAVAILGTGVAACSSNGDSTPEGATSATATPAPDATPVPTTEPEAIPSEPEAEAQSPEVEEPLGRLSWSQVALGNVSAYVLVRGNQAAVVDTGNPGSTGDIGAALADVGVGWSDVAHVILTHQHRDHVGSLNDVLVEAASAVAYAGEADIAFIQSDNALQPVGDGDSVFGLEVLNTPGHTPGSISVFDGEIGMLFAGDALNGTGDGTGLLGPNRQFSSDMDQANESVRKLAALDVEAAAFGHGNPVEAGAGALLDDLVASL